MIASLVGVVVGKCVQLQLLNLVSGFAELRVFLANCCLVLLAELLSLTPDIEDLFLFVFQLPFQLVGLGLHVFQLAFPKLASLLVVRKQ